MARPIDADNVLERIENIAQHWQKQGKKYEAMLVPSVMKSIIDSEPALTPPNEWVSVEKRLPEDDAPAGRKQITVMVTTKAGKVTIASRVFEPERDYCGKVYPARWLWSRWLNNYVTHWMPLPAPPDSRPPERQEDT